MRNILIITQKVDENDDLLGFFVGWIREFSKKFDKVFVITLMKGEYNLPENVFVYSLGKEKNNPKIIRILNFYKLLFRLIPKSNGVFAHMSPIFVVASWPIAFIFRKKIILWYLHRSVTPRLKLAEKICYKIVTSTKESLNIKSKKIVEVGHGIDAERFKIKRSWKNDTGLLKILSVGRISKIKDYETLIKAAKILKEKGLKFEIKIVGRPVMPYDFDYFEKLKKMVGDLRLKDFIEFAGFVPYSRIADYYKKADIFVNLAPKGGIDKAVLEAMAAGCLVAVANESFSKYFGGRAVKFFFEHGDQKSLTSRLIDFYNANDTDKKIISEFLVQAAEQHSISSVVSRISALI